ncbi:DUF1353 domain-containing protein [Allosediminivita pacifica]|nr:DUF1353 domain-containing protein [Allosediminivita pacifica]
MLAISVAIATPGSAAVGCGEETAGAHCRFENAPAQISDTQIILGERPHPYSELLAPLRFTDSRGVLWTAPSATLTDGASIPTIFVPLIGDPRSPEFLAAASLHDAYCGLGNEALPQYHQRSWQETHRMFYDSLRAAGVPATKAKTMFAAVYLGGPRWDDPSRSLADVPEARLREEMERCIAFIEREDPDLAEIEDWMSRREPALRVSQ